LSIFIEVAVDRRIRNPSADGIYFPTTMAKKVLCYLMFFILETLIILGSIVVVVCLYLPFVVLKALVMTVTGKVTPRTRPAPSLPSNG
jgi:hypothetical protein